MAFVIISESTETTTKPIDCGKNANSVVFSVDLKGVLIPRPYKIKMKSKRVVRVDLSKVLLEGVAVLI